MPVDISRIDQLKLKYPQVDVDVLADKFAQLDVKNSGSLVQHDAFKLVQALPEKYGFDQINKAMKAHVTGGMELDEFVQVAAALKQQGVIKPANYDPEVAALVEYINHQLERDADLAEKLPFQPDSPQIFHEVKDGIVLAKLINKVVSSTIDESKLVKSANITAFQRTANQNAVIAGAKQIGSTATCGASDIESGNQKVLIGLLQSILKIDLQIKVSLKSAPEIQRLAKPNEDQSQLAKLKTEEILLRWINYHAERNNVTRVCTNLDKDLKDGEFFTILFKTIAPQHCDNQPMRELDTQKRALLLVDYASRCGVDQFITVESITSGNTKLNVAFLAALFSQKHAILPLDLNEYVSPNTQLFEQQDRSIVQFTIWINSLGFSVENLLEQLQDGQILAGVINKIIPNTVEMRRINKTTTSRIKKLENANYIVEVSKKIGIVANLGGNDLAEGNKALLLAYLSRLQQLSIDVEVKKAGVQEADLLQWANKYAKLGGSTATLTSFKDAHLTNSRFYVEIMAGFNKRAVNWGFVQEGQSDDVKRENAKYAISVSVALGIVTFVGVEDILESKVKLVRFKFKIC